MRQEDALNLLQPYVDGELDAATSLELERYLMGDAIARAQLARLRALSSALRAETDYHVAPGSLRTSILSRTRGAAVPGPQGSTRHGPAHWLRSIGIGVAAAAFASIATVALLRPTQQDLTEHDIFAAHARATVSDRLLDVASSDQHTVKPWLSARLGFSPPVPDLSGSGFELAGGRLDVIGGQRVAVIVYRRRQHMIDVLVRPAGGETPSAESRDGFNLSHFTHNGMSFWLISDLNANELADLARLLVARAGP